MIRSTLVCTVGWLVIVILNCVATLPAFAAPGQRAKIVIMLDLTGSTSLTDLEISKNAARTILNISSGTPALERPYIAIGTFSVQDQNAARILGPLTDEYGTESPATGHYAVLNAITSTGGYTDISAAIATAQAHLEGSSYEGFNNIVLLSDGTSNRPGAPSYTQCDECGCDFANAAANSAATAAEQAGTRIFGIHYAGNGVPFTCPGEPNEGQQFLRNEIASSPDYFYLGNQDLSGIFAEVSCTISCDDGDPCTTDSCDVPTKTCFYQQSTADSDNDGVPNCRDTCLGDNATLGLACTDGDGSCARSGSFRCGPEGRIGCASAALVDTRSCFGCASKDASPLVAQAQTVLVNQAKATKTLGKLLRKALPRSASTSQKKTASTAIAKSKSSTITVATAIAALPRVYDLCTNTQSCQLVQYGVQVTRLSEHGAELFLASKKAWAQLRKLSGVDQKAAKKAYRTVTAANKTLATILPQLPTARSDCLLQ